MHHEIRMNSVFYKDYKYANFAVLQAFMTSLYTKCMVAQDNGCKVHYNGCIRLCSTL